MSQWGSFRKNILNNGLQEVEVIRKSKPFKFKTGGLIWGSPVIDEKENIYIGSADKYFYSINSVGKLNWKYKIRDDFDSLIDSAAVITKSMVIIPGGDGYLHAVNKKTGRGVWTFRAYHAKKEQVESGELVNSFEGNVVQGPNGFLYAGSDNGHMYCLDEKGSEVWNFKTGMMIWSAPVFHPNGKWMCFGSLDGYLYLLNPANGKLISKKWLGEIKASPSYDLESNLLFVGNSNGQMYALKVLDKRLKIIWKFGAKKEIYSSVSYDKRRVYFGSADGNLYCVGYDGKLVWKFNCFSSILGSPVLVKDKMVVFGAADGRIYVLNLVGNLIGFFKTTRFLHKANLDSSPAVSKSGRIYVGSYNGTVYGIPISSCLKKGKRKKIKFEGNKVLQFEDKHANLSDRLEVGLSEPVKICLTVPNAAKNSRGLKVLISPKVNFFHRVSADGQFINIIPQSFWEPETKYSVRVKGSYFTKSTFLMNRLKWVFLPKVNQELVFSTKEMGSSKFFEEIGKKGRSFGISDIALFQPRSVNSLVAAGMDGQKYLLDFFDRKGDKFKIRFFPAYEKGKKFHKIEGSGREGVLKARFKGKYFVARGSPILSAMGATIPLEKVFFSGAVDGGRIKNGMIFSETSVFKIKGNLVKYRFPLKLIDDVFGIDLKLRTVLGFKGRIQ
ncbi:PQQ-binding-like beta-propeller repeat protein [Nanoarchaeota archaeon]